MADPIKRDLRAYTFMAMCSLVGVVTIALMGGLFLKQERKLKPITYSDNGCYLWSDGHVQCRREP